VTLQHRDEVEVVATATDDGRMIKAITIGNGAKSATSLLTVMTLAMGAGTTEVHGVD